MRLHFVELRVRDWTASVAWYRDVLGLEVLLEDAAGRFALLRAGEGRVALKAGEPGAGVVLAFEVDALRPWLERLGAADVKVSAEGYRRARLSDPDGYAVVLFEWGEPGAPGPQD